MTPVGPNDPTASPPSIEIPVGPGGPGDPTKPVDPNFPTDPPAPGAGASEGTR